MKKLLFILIFAYASSYAQVSDHLPVGGVSAGNTIITTNRSDTNSRQAFLYYGNGQSDRIVRTHDLLNFSSNSPIIGNLFNSPLTTGEASKFTATTTGSTFTFGSTGLSISGTSTGVFNDNIYWNQHPSLITEWQTTANITVTSIPHGFWVGYSDGSEGPVAYVDSVGHVQIRDVRGSSLVTSQGRLNISSGDKLRITLVHMHRALYATVIDATTNKTIHAYYNLDNSYHTYQIQIYGNPALGSAGGTYLVTGWTFATYKKRNSLFALIGDSITDFSFSGVSDGDTYSSLVTNGIKSDRGMEVYAIAGLNLAQAQNALTDILNAQPSFCLINLGVNDAIGNQTPAAILANIHAMADTLSAHGIVPIIITPNPFHYALSCNPILKSVRDSLVTTTPYNDYLVINTWDKMAQPGYDYINTLYDSGDGHPNKLGHRVMASTILAKLDSAQLFSGGSRIINGNVTSYANLTGGSLSNFNAIGNDPNYSWKNTTAGTDGKTWDETVAGNTWILRLISDDNASLSNVMAVTRSGMTVTSMGITPALTVNNTVTASQFIRPGGGSNSFLKADGSIDNTAYNSGNGTNGYLTQYTGTNLQANSALFQTTNGIGFGTTAPTAFGGFTNLALNNPTNGGLLEFKTADVSKALIYNSVNDLTLATLTSAGKVLFKTNNNTYTNLSLNPDGTSTFSGAVSGTSFSGSLTGNASTATALQTGRTISSTGDISYTSPLFDGTANVTAAATLATVNSNVGSFGSTTSIPSFTVNGKGLITAASGNTISYQAPISVTTTGSGAASFVSNVLNIPTPGAAYITSLTTTGNSGASSVTSGALNVPNYTLTGLGGQPLLSLTSGYVPKATGTSTLGNSLIYDTGSDVGIGTTTPTHIGGFTILAINGGTNGGLVDFQAAGVSKGWIYSAANDLSYVTRNAAGTHIFTTNGGTNLTLSADGSSTLNSHQLHGVSNGTSTYDAVNYGQLSTYAPLASPAFTGNVTVTGGVTTGGNITSSGTVTGQTGLGANNYRVTNVAAGTSSTDAVNLAQLQASQTVKALFSNNYQQQDVNSSSQTELLSNDGAVPVVPIGVVGKQIITTLGGTYSTPAITAGTLTVRVIYNGTTIATGTASGLLAGASGLAFDGSVSISTISVGTSGTVYITGGVNYSVANNAARFTLDLNNGGNLATVNNSVAGNFEVTAQWDTASTSKILNVNVGRVLTAN